MSKHEKINYIEFPAKDLVATKQFLKKVFGWSFVDYGAEYVALVDAGIDGGFYQSDSTMSSDNGSALIILYSQELEQTQKKIEEAGGKINKAIFSFPGGRRFHFIDVNGNEFAVWSDC